jgi:hypothetical protein
MDEQGNWKLRALLFGGLIGALTGVGAALLLVQRAEREGGRPQVGTGEGIRLGLLLLGLLRQVGELVEPRE